MTTKPEVNVQGKAIVDSYSDGFYLILPDGVINWYTSKAKIVKAVKAWAKKNSGNYIHDSLLGC